MRRSSEGHWTFIPRPLPPELDINTRLLACLSEATLAVGQLAGIAELLPNPKLLWSPFVRREAVLSSRIEGTRATSEDLALFEAAPERPTPSGDAREVANYVRALEHGLARIRTLPVSLRLVRELHAILMEGVGRAEIRPGEFRARQNFIGRLGDSIAEARYVPPAVPDMLAALNEWEKYLHAPSKYPLLIDLALTHYQFEAIHPFLDGNGRIGRLLITLLLAERGVLPQPLLYLSAYFERHREDYVNGLQAVSENGEWESWLWFFLTGVAEQARDSVARSRQLARLREDFRRAVQPLRASGALSFLIDHLFARPAITISQAQEIMSAKTFHTARGYIERLVEQRILVEHTGAVRNRIFIAPQILEIIEADVAKP